MRNRRLDFPASSIVGYVNSGEETLAGGSLVRIGALGWGVLVADIPAGAAGAAYTQGRFELPKAEGVAFGQGVAVGWDAGNGRIQAATNGRPVGTLAEDATEAATVAIVNLNTGPEVFAAVVTGDASGSGLTIDTGFGAVPAGPIIVQVYQANGTARTLTSVVALGGDDAGKVTVVASAGAGTDKVHLIAYRN